MVSKNKAHIRIKARMEELIRREAHVRRKDHVRREAHVRRKAHMEELIRKEVMYPCTNESIPAVVAGLDLSASDVVVSIAGSGDIPFAIAPYVSKVCAVDSNKYQLEFMREQMEFLRSDDFEGFCRREFMKMATFDQVGCQGMYSRDVGMHNMDARECYFERRFSEVRDSLSRIEICNAGILEFMGTLDEGSVDKVYLSNVPERLVDSGADADCIIRAMKVGGIVYDSSRQSHDSMQIGKRGELKINDERTKEAGDIYRMNSDFYNWEPSVYERVA